MGNYVYILHSFSLATRLDHNKVTCAQYKIITGIWGYLSVNLHSIRQIDNALNVYIQSSQSSAATSFSYWLASLLFCLQIPVYWLIMSPKLWSWSQRTGSWRCGRNWVFLDHRWNRYQFQLLQRWLDHVWTSSSTVDLNTFLERNCQGSIQPWRDGCS